MKTNKEYNKLEQEIVRLLNERDSALQALRWCLRQIAEYLGTWYGHTTEQKYERISGYAAAGASPVQPSQADAQDAARYRWLRSTTNWASNSSNERIDVRNSPELWDAAIDAAMKESK